MKIAWTVFIFLSALAWSILVEEFIKDIEQLDKEGLCISEYIALGFERSEIYARNGNCFLIKRS